MGFRPKKRTQTVIMRRTRVVRAGSRTRADELRHVAGADHSGADGLSMLDVIHSVEKMAHSLISWEFRGPGQRGAGTD